MQVSLPKELIGCVNPDVCHILPFSDQNGSPGVISGQAGWASMGSKRLISRPVKALYEWHFHLKSP